jgi:hypothetical protein
VSDSALVVSIAKKLFVEDWTRPLGVKNKITIKPRVRKMKNIPLVDGRRCFLKYEVSLKMFTLLFDLMKTDLANLAIYHTSQS